jgi:hypothetical protein
MASRRVGLIGTIAMVLLSFRVMETAVAAVR